MRYKSTANQRSIHGNCVRLTIPHAVCKWIRIASSATNLRKCTRICQSLGSGNHIRPRNSSAYDQRHPTAAPETMFQRTVTVPIIWFCNRVVWFLLPPPLQPPFGVIISSTRVEKLICAASALGACHGRPLQSVGTAKPHAVDLRA